MISWYVLVIDNASHPVWKITLQRPRKKCLRTHLLQQLPQPVQLRFQLFVVILQDLHPGLQAALVLAKQLGLCDELGVAGALRGHRHHLRRGRQRGQPLVLVLLLQPVVLCLQVPGGKWQGGKSFMAPAQGSEQTLLCCGVMCLTSQGSPAVNAFPSPECTHLWACSLQILMTWY